MTYADKERLGDEIAELAAHLDAATHRLLVLISEFDASGGWADQGALSCAHWLGWRIGLELGAAREHVRVARALRELPAVDEALRCGRVSYSKVRALTRVATPENEVTLLGMARASTASQLERICRGYRRATRTDGREPEDDEDARWVREGETGDGFVRFDIQLRTEEAALLRRALEVAADRAWTRKDVPAGTRAARLRRADALVALLESYLSGTSSTSAAGGAASRRCCVARSACATAAAASRAARTAGSTAITSCPGRKEGRRRCATWCRCAGGTTGTWDGKAPDYGFIVSSLIPATP